MEKSINFIISSKCIDYIDIYILIILTHNMLKTDKQKDTKNK